MHVPWDEPRHTEPNTHRRRVGVDQRVIVVAVMIRETDGGAAAMAALVVTVVEMVKR